MNMNLTNRRAGCGLMYINAAHRPDARSKCWISNGDSADLNLGQDFVHVVDIERIGSHFRGRAVTFGYSPDDTVGDISIGDLIEFEEHHVLSCSAS